ncbi:unnamed protein product [Cyclocybe aegerita]|uniref:Uncharacterized protein n=1 Tax=Cyclocybe aegerita TaxID=1973307 RepID=A0A8S0WJ00_CYCAE|nr:unnamed protein product [Cyclocybe aegerita]
MLSSTKETHSRRSTSSLCTSTTPTSSLSITSSRRFQSCLPYFNCTVWKLRGRCLVSERLFMKLFLVDEHGVETYQMTAVVPWPTWKTNTSSFMQYAAAHFDHPELQKESRGPLSLRCATREGEGVVWTHVSVYSWACIRPQDELAIFISRTKEESQDGHDPVSDAKDAGAVRPEFPQLVCLTCTEHRATGADDTRKFANTRWLFSDARTR